MKKRFGQHFLTDRSVIPRIIQLAHIGSDETVVEIGPGAGVLTSALAAVAQRVIAIEIDSDLIPKLRASMPSNVEIIEGDALIESFPQSPFHLVGNLPYNVATPLFKKFIACRDQILDVTVMIQQEVAERLIAKPGTREYGPLSVLVQYYATIRYGFTVGPGAFRPHPRVESAVIRLEWKPDVPEAKDFTDFAQRCFSSRRKKLANNLLSIFPGLRRDEIASVFKDVGIPIGARPENLSVEQLLAMYNQFCRRECKPIRLST